MKITREYLKKVIKEELERAVNENEHAQKLGLPANTRTVAGTYLYRNIPDQFKSVLDKLDHKSYEASYLVPSPSGDKVKLFGAVDYNSKPQDLGIEFPISALARFGQTVAG